jgi:hypothetical protein
MLGCFRATLFASRIFLILGLVVVALGCQDAGTRTPGRRDEGARSAATSQALSFGANAIAYW